MAETYLTALDQNEKPLGYLTKAKGVEVRERLNGEALLSFEVPYDKDTEELVALENYVKLDDGNSSQLYVIKSVEYGDSGKRTLVIRAVHVYIELVDEYIDRVVDLLGVTASEALTEALQGTEFSVGVVEPTELHDIDLTEISSQKAVQEIRKKWDCDLWFDNRTVNLGERGSDNGAEIRYGREMKALRKPSKSSDVITRLYPYGRDGLTIEGVNDGVKYVDSPNIGNYRRPKQASKRWNDITDASELKARAERYLAEQDTPEISYEVDFLELANIGVSGIGDTVTITHVPFDLKTVGSRVVELSRYPFEHRPSRAVLSNYIETNIDTFVELKREQITFEKYANERYKAITTDISEMDVSLTDLQSDFSRAISDDVVTENEAQTLKRSLEEVQNESQDVIDSAGKYGITTEKTNYQNALADLETELTNNWIDQSSYPIDITATQRDLIRAKFSAVQDKKSLLASALGEARNIEISGWGIINGGSIRVENRQDNVTTYTNITTTQSVSPPSYLTSIDVGDTSSLPSSCEFGTYFIGYDRVVDSVKVESGDSNTLGTGVYAFKWSSKTSTTLEGVQIGDYLFGGGPYANYPCEVDSGMAIYNYAKPTGDVVVSPLTVNTPDFRKVSIPTTTFSNETFGANVGDYDGWEFRYIYLDTNDNVLIKSAGTSGGLDEYPPDPPSGSTRIGYMLVGYGKQEPDDTLNSTKDLDSAGRPAFKERIYHDIRYRDEKRVKVNGDQLELVDTPYGTSTLNLSVSSGQYVDKYINIGKGKRSISLSLTLDDGTDYDNYDYGASITLGRKSANNADGQGRPLWATYSDADNNRGHVQQQRNRSPYGVHILTPRVWNKSYTLLYDADIMPDPSNPEELAIKLTFHNYHSSYTDGSFDLKVNWHAL